MAAITAPASFRQAPLYPQARAEDSTPFMDENEIAALEACIGLFGHPVDCLEWGSGRSTRYFSALLPPGSAWHSIEHDAGWAEAVHKDLQKQGVQQVELYHVPNNLPFADGIEDGTYRQFRDYVRCPQRLDRQFHLILVDGRARVACMLQGWELLHEEGVLILHDAHREEYDAGIPGDALQVRIVNPERNHGEGQISVLFLGKSPGRMRQLAAALGGVLAPHLRITFSGEAAETTGPARPSCLFLNTYYRGFLERLYARNPELALASYAEQHRRIQQECFGDSDFYSHGLALQGWQSADLIVNWEPLQQRWAGEHGVQGDWAAVALAQIEAQRPDVVYVQDMNLFPAELLLRLRQRARLVVGQIATPVVRDIPFGQYDLVISSFPHYVEELRRHGVCSCYQPLAFDPRVLETLEFPAYRERPIACSFVGGISNLHLEAHRLLDLLATETPAQFWGYGAASLPADSPVRQRHNGEAWGSEMFSVLAHSSITINRHGEVALNYANNMRLYEATGCGALVITDYKDNLPELFEVGKEIVAYRSPEECVALVQYYLDHPEEAEAIAAAGQQRTLRDHSYALRMAQTAELLERHLRYDRERYKLEAPDMAKVSYGKTQIARENIGKRLTAGWQSEAIPLRQRALVQSELEALYRGEPPSAYVALADALRPYVRENARILEVGCATGYYYEVLEYLLNRRIRYTGVDYSEPMIAMARDYYPKAEFEAADGAHLPFEDARFDVAISSGVLLHVLDYQDQIREAARVSAGLVIAHRTPVSFRKPLQHLKKFAYGVETLEMRFNERELLQNCSEAGLALVNTIVLSSNAAADEHDVTYVFKKVAL